MLGRFVLFLYPLALDGHNLHRPCIDNCAMNMQVTHLMMFMARRRNKQRPRKCGHALLALAGVGTVRGRFSALHKSGHARSAAPTHVCVVGGLAKIHILRLRLDHGHKQGLIGGSR